MVRFRRVNYSSLCNCGKAERQQLSLSQRIRFRIRLIFDCFMGIFYNSFISRSYVFDTLLEPGIWFVDRFAKFLGPLFVLGVVILKSSVVAIAYIVGLPYYWEHKDHVVTISIVIFGQFFFVNVVFHYWMALKTEPGRVPNSTPKLGGDSHEVILKQVTSICKKCIGPKPPRTHHCSVCNRCVLKMDHHCPWINGCIGHFNHRYFFLYMVYTVLGCLFIMVFGFEIIYNELFDEASKTDSIDQDLVLNLVSRRAVIIYEAFITTGTFLILGGLSLWHAKLISRGETCIEAHINRNEAKRMATDGKVYKNPFDFGPYHNWCLFLGLIEGRTFWTVLWPSTHKPKGDGLTWDSIFSCDIHWNDMKGKKRLDASKLA